MARSNFIVRGGADFSGIKNEIDKTQNQFKKFQFNIGKGFRMIGKAAGITLGVKAMMDFGKAAIKVSSDLEEIQNVVNITFGSMTQDVNEFSKGLIRSHGLGELSAKKYASYMGAMLKSSGIHGDVMTEMSKDLALLTADMASFYNLDNEEMFQKLMSAMSGSVIPLRQLGINMTIANLEAFALSQGIQKSWQEMSQAEQVMLRYNYLMSATSDSQGDFARNNWNWAHSVKILGETWKEFLGIVGTGLQTVVLPLVKALIKVLEVLIAIARTIGKIYTMITGKELVAETNYDIGDSAFDAAEGEEELADGIGKAAKAAQKALAPFDELNILQQNMGAGGVGGSVSGLGDLNIDTDMGLNKIGDSLAEGLEKTREESNRFYLWFTDKWTGLKEMLATPIYVANPIFPIIPSPVFEPEWGLDIPKIPNPIFPPIPSPVYRPNWGLTPPPIPAVNYQEYANSLERMKVKTDKVIERIGTSTIERYEKMKDGVLGYVEGIRLGSAELWEGIQLETFTTMEQIRTGLSTGWEAIEGNFETHKGNVGVIAAGIAATLIGNTNIGLTTTGLNTNNALERIQENMQTWGSNVGEIAIETASSFARNLSEGYQAASVNFSNFATTMGENMRAFGSGFLTQSAETARGFVDNMVSGFSTVWSNFRNLMSGMGERVSGWFSENKSMVTKVAIGAGIAVGAGALALAAPAAIPYIATGLSGLATIPALKTGAITGVNDPFIAMVGDHPSQREVISPLDDLMNMITSAVGTALIGVNQFEGGTRVPIITKVYLNDREIAKAIYDPLEEEKSRRGKPMIEPV